MNIQIGAELKFCDILTSQSIFEYRLSTEKNK